MTGCIVVLILSAGAGFAAYGWGLGKGLTDAQAGTFGLFAGVGVFAVMGLLYKVLTSPISTGTPPPQMTWNPNTNRREPVQEPLYSPDPNYEYYGEKGGIANRHAGTIIAKPIVNKTCPNCGQPVSDCMCIEIGDVRTKTAQELQAEENNRWARHYREASRRAEKYHPEDSSGFVHTIGGKIVDD